jgi:GntR family transcriptional regulator
MSLHVAINTTDARPIYVQIMDEVRRALVLGTLGPEDPLPSVRQLAADLRLNPNTVAQAYRELEREGIVYVRRGQGTFAVGHTSPEVERWALARDVAERAIIDAHRHGLGAEELVEAIREAADAASPPRSTEASGSR